MLCRSCVSRLLNPVPAAHFKTMALAPRRSCSCQHFRNVLHSEAETQDLSWVQLHL